jgi:hypothetical protein
MNQVAHPKAQKIEALLPQLRAMPQVECTEKHYFGPGMYVKEVTMPAGSIIVGKPHKTEHLCVMLQGRMELLKDDGSIVELVAPATFVGKPGRKIARIIETVVFQNIFATDETDVEKLEHMFVESPLLEGN